MVPCWDLTVVLDAFTKSPFQPWDMASVELKFLTFKRVFLLSLASGARRGEIHTLDRYHTRWSSNGKSIFLRPYVGFMTKTHVALDPSTVLTGFWIKLLSALCPGRALQFYLYRTDPNRTAKKLLFLPLRERASRKLSPNTISA